MCSPEHYNVDYEINAWMDIHNEPDTDLAKDQWEILYDTITDLGARFV